MKLLITGGTGVLGRALRPRAEAAGHELRMPTHRELDLFDPSAVTAAVPGTDAILHLASRVLSLDRMGEPGAWDENDRLRNEASRVLVDAGLAADVAVYVQPTIAFVYPEGGPTSEDTVLTDVPQGMRSALVAEHETARFAWAGRRGVVLRLGLLDGPGTGHDEPSPVLGSTLHVNDAADALLRALTAPSGIYNVCRDREGVTNQRFSELTGWRPTF